MAEANRLDEVIDDLSAETSAALARAEAAEAAETSLRHEWRDYTRAKVQEFADMQRELNSTRAEVERLRSQVVTLEAEAKRTRPGQLATCSSCDWPVNRFLDAVVCDRCYEKFLA